MAASNVDVLSSNSNGSSTSGSGLIISGSVAGSLGVVVAGASGVVDVSVVPDDVFWVRMVIVGTRDAALFARLTAVRWAVADIASPVHSMAQNAKIIGVPMWNNGQLNFILCVICV